MSNDELLLAISNMIDEKLKSVQMKLKTIQVFQENELLPRLQNIESCYVDTYRRYQAEVESIAGMKQDIEIMKKVLMEHSEKLQKLA